MKGIAVYIMSCFQCQIVDSMSFEIENGMECVTDKIINNAKKK